MGGVIGMLGLRYVGFLFRLPPGDSSTYLGRGVALDDLRGVKPGLDRTYSIPCECFGLLGIRMSLYHGFGNAYRSIGQLDGA